MSHSSPLGRERLHRVADHAHGDVDLGAALLVVVHVLHRALIGLQAREPQPRSRVDRAGDAHHVLGRVHPAAARAAVDLHQALDLGAVTLRGLRQVRHVGLVVHAHEGARAQQRQPREPVDLGRVAHLVGDQHVGDAAAGEDLGLRDLLAAHTAGPAHLHLEAGHVHGLVHLAVHAMAHAVLARVVAHLAHVALERAQVEHQAGGLDLGLVHARHRRHVVAHLQLVEVGHVLHGVLLSSSRADGPDRRSRQ